MKDARFDRVKSVKWDSAIPALPADTDLKSEGEVTLDDDATIPIYLHLKGDAHLEPESHLQCPNEQPTCPDGLKQIKDWDSATTWTVLDYRSADPMYGKIDEGRMTPLDNVLLVFSGGLLFGFIGLIWYYVRGLERRCSS